MSINSNEKPWAFMGRIVASTACFTFLTIGELGGGGGQQREIPIGVDQLEGKPVDLGISAIKYYAGSKQNTPELQWLTDGKDGTFCGLMWEETKSVTRVILNWAEDAEMIPNPDELLLETWGGKFSWWTGEWKVRRIRPQVRNGGRTYVYTLHEPVECEKVRFRHRQLTEPSHFAVPTLQVEGPETLVWKRTRVKLEFGLDSTSEHEVFGELDIHNGIITELLPLDGEKGPAIVPPKSFVWKGVGKRAVVAEFLYTAEREPVGQTAGFFLENLNGNPINFNRSIRDYPLMIGDESFKHGIGTILGSGRQSKSQLRIYSPNPIAEFTAWVGNDENWTSNRKRGSVVFVVKAGQEELFRSGVLRGGDQPVRVALKVAGAKTLDLIVEDNGDGFVSDQPNWADAAIVTDAGERKRIDELKVWYDLKGKIPSCRTVVTVRSTMGDFSFTPTDLEAGDGIYLPGHGFYLSNAKHLTESDMAVKQLKAKGLKTIRERVRELPEQTLERAMRSAHPESILAPYPEPPYRPPMRIEVPEQNLNSAWELAGWHLKRRCIPRDDGLWVIPDYPYPQLAQETYLIIRALDFMGFTDVCRGGIEEWFTHQGESKPYGLLSDKTGATTIQIFMSELHGTGPGTLLWNTAEHYFLTGDRDWLKRMAKKIQAACEWNIRQRKLWTEQLGSERDAEAWLSGLLPPLHIGDLTAWRSWYYANAMYYVGLRRCADALIDVDRDVGFRLHREADKYKEDILAALDKSVRLAPVTKVQNGMYRTVLPPAPYIRGLASQILHPQSCGHGGTPWADAEFGALALVQAEVVSPLDKRVDAFLDVLEDTILYDNSKLRARKKVFAPEEDYVPERDWFDHAGIYYQNGYLATPIVYLMQDDISNFLRTFYNHYALEVMPDKGYTFREHTPRHVVEDKSFEEAAFVERMRLMLLMEEGDSLWIAKGTPRTWLADGKVTSVSDAPTFFGKVTYRIVSEVNDGKILASISGNLHKTPAKVFLRLRHPERKLIKSVTINGESWTDFDSKRELVVLKNISGNVAVVANY